MSASVDYLAIALITVLTAFCANISQKFGDELVKYIRYRLELYRKYKVNQNINKD